MNIVTKNISDLTLNKKNPRVNDAAAERLVKGIETYGFVNPVIANKDGLVLAGHTRIKALKKMGQKTVPVLYVDMDDATAKGFSIYDNKSAEFSSWDDELLESEIKELMDMDFNIDLTGFSIDDFDFGEKGGLTDEDELPDVPEEPFTKLNDLWICGEHRVLCGDSTKADDIKKLMHGVKADMVFTDPPYDFKEDFLKNCFEFINEGHIFVMDGDKNHAANTARYIDKFNVFYVIFFKSPTWNLSKKIPLTQHLLVAQYRTGKAKNRELKMLHSVIELSTKNDRSVSEYVAKRQEAIVPFIENFSDINDIVLDLFTGSGSVLIACENLKRKYYGIELDPCICDLAINRWEAYTGSKARLSE